MGSTRSLVVALLGLVLTPTTLTASEAASAHSSAAKVPGSHVLLSNDRDGDEDVYGLSADGRRLAALTRNRARDSAVVMSPDGRWFAVERDYSRTVLVSADGRRERRLGVGTTAIAFSPNGRLLAVEQEKPAFSEIYRIFLFPVDGGRPRSLGRGEPISFSPDGRSLLYWTSDGRLALVRLRDAIRRVLAGTGEAAEIAWSPDGARISFQRERTVTVGSNREVLYTLYVVDLRSRAARPKAILSGLGTLGTWWLPGSTIGFIRGKAGEEGDEIGVVGATGGRRRSIASDVLWPEWSPRGDRVAYSRKIADDTYEFVVASTDGSQRRVLFPRADSGARWSTSGRLLAVMVRGADVPADDGSSDLFVLGPGSARLTRLAHGVRGGSVVWSPDDNRLALSTEIGLTIFSLEPKPRAVRTVRLDGNWAVLGWVRGALARTAPKAPPPPPIETATTRLLSARGSISELASDGPRTVALVGKSALDCDHVVGWVPSTRAIFRTQRVRRCEDEGHKVFFNLRLTGTTLRWQTFHCGNYCYVTDYAADLRTPYRERYLDERVVEEGERLLRPPPPRETHRGVVLTLTGGAITLRREADGRLRTIRPPGGAVDAELEDEGLFYAYHAGKATMPGRLAFVPFADLFTD